MAAGALGAIMVVGMTGLLVLLVLRGRRRDMVRLVITLDVLGAALVIAPLWWFISTLGPCTDPTMC